MERRKLKTKRRRDLNEEKAFNDQEEEEEREAEEAHGKMMANNKLCRLCKEPLPRIALAFSNKTAIAGGWCSWMCMSSDLGSEKAYQVLSDKTKQNMHERMRERRSQP